MTRRTVWTVATGWIVAVGVLLGGFGHGSARAQDTDPWATEPLPPEPAAEPMAEPMGADPMAEPTDAFEADEDDLETSYARRKLVLSEGVVRGDFSLDVLRFDFGRGPLGFNETFVSMNLGGAIGAIENLEVGIADMRTGFWPAPNLGGFDLLPIILTPDADFGDIPMYGRYQFLDTEVVQLGAELMLRIPTNTDFGMRFGLPVRFTAGMVAIDTGVAFDVRFDARVNELDPDEDTVTALLFPVRATFNPIDEVFFGPWTGFFVNDFDVDFLTIPLGITGGYTLALPDAGAMLDFYAHFGWPFFWLESAGEVVTEIWQLNFGANFYYDVY